MDQNARKRETIRVGLALAIALLVFVIELVKGLEANSLSLFLDGLHVGADLASLVGSLIIAVVLYRRPNVTSEEEQVYETRMHRRAALLNAKLLAVVVFVIISGSFIRLFNPGKVEGALVFGWGLFGLGGNILQRLILSGCPCFYHRSIRLHIDSDMWTSIAVIIGGPAIFFTGWHWIDPLLCLGIGIYIAKTTRNLFRSLRKNERVEHHH